MLSDKSTNTVFNKNPTRKMINGLHELLVRWKNHNYILDTMYKRSNCTDGVLPRTYGLPKIYEPNCLLRIIVSSISTPLNPLATFLHNIIYNAIPRVYSYISLIALNQFKNYQTHTQMTNLNCYHWMSSLFFSIRFSFGQYFGEVVLSKKKCNIF